MEGEADDLEHSRKLWENENGHGRQRCALEKRVCRGKKYHKKRNTGNISHWKYVKDMEIK